MSAVYCGVCGVRVFARPKVGARGYRCAGCQGTFCGKHVRYYIDGSNGRITESSPPRCAVCYPMTPALNLSGVLDIGNLLLSGDYVHRVAVRARFRVELMRNGSRVTS